MMENITIGHKGTYDAHKHIAFRAHVVEQLNAERRYMETKLGAFRAEQEEDKLRTPHEYAVRFFGFDAMVADSLLLMLTRFEAQFKVAAGSELVAVIAGMYRDALDEMLTEMGNGSGDIMQQAAGLAHLQAWKRMLRLLDGMLAATEDLANYDEAGAMIVKARARVAGRKSKSS